ncbi:MAG: serine hydrolase [Bacteroidales bacterium]|nr:serine hydrolase [Bacteroidales bacterium]
MTQPVLVALCLCLLAPVTSWGREPVPLPDSQWPGIAEQVVARSLRDWKAPGVAIVIVQGDRTIVLKGLGVRSLGQDAPITPDTMFPIASCTKAFTSALLARLVDQRKLQWDDPVRKHAPTFRLSDPHADALVTVRDIVSHRTGVAGHDLLWYRAPWDLNETVRRTLRLPLEAPFRAGYRYSSTMFLVAGRIAENRGEAHWDQLIREQFCEPLGMKSVVFSTAEMATIADQAHGHRRASDGTIVAMPAYEDRGPNPSGSIRASVRDLAAWLKFHLSGGLAPDGTRLVSEANLLETRTPQTIMKLGAAAQAVYPVSNQISYGMGWVLYDYHGYGVTAHGGMIDCFRTQITLVPRAHIGIAVVNNLHQSMMNAAITNTILDRILDLPTRDWNRHYLGIEQAERDEKRHARERQDAARNPDQPPSLPLTAYTGSYEHPAYGTGTVSLSDNQLIWKWSSFRCPLRHHHGDVFEVEGGYCDGDLITFQVIGRRAVRVQAVEQMIFTRP